LEAATLVRFIPRPTSRQAQSFYLSCSTRGAKLSVNSGLSGTIISRSRSGFFLTPLCREVQVRGRISGTYLKFTEWLELPARARRLFFAAAAT
jgi:hypothetical protein